MKIMNLILVVLLLMGLSLALAEERLKLATTTSTENSGLLKVLLPPFENKYKVKVDVIAVGTGQTLSLGRQGDVDVVLVHDPKSEENFVAEGYGVNWRGVMYNDFILVGPPSDPARIKGLKSAVQAFQKIGRRRYPFISRGDKSGTHTKELEVWAKAGIRPKGNWYIEAGKGMGEVLNMAQEMKGYTLSDRGTYLAYKKKVGLALLYEGDSILFNPYGIIAVNPVKFPQVKYELAKALIDWVTSEEGQKVIREFKDKEGHPLFVPQVEERGLPSNKRK